MWETWVRYLGLEDPLEEGTATLVWEIPWTAKPAGLQTVELQSQTRLSD